jgi:uncharacterized phage infection (PIP) family protein YhgE
MNKRHRNKWTTPEVLALQREYELLEMNIYDIANKHQRNATGIAYKLYNEGFIRENLLEDYLQEINKQVTEESANIVSESSDLQNRMTHLEENIKDISNTIKQLLQERQRPRFSSVRALRCNSHL